MSHPASAICMSHPSIASTLRRLMTRPAQFCFCLALLACSVAAEVPVELQAAAPRLPTSFWDTAKATLKEYKGETKFDINEFTGFKSISGSGDHVNGLHEAAQWLIGRLGHMQVQNTRVHDTDGVHPIVYGDWLLAGSHKPTILIYASFDVPPLNPLLNYDEPFKLGISDEAFWGRGVAGGKGALLMAIQGVETILRTLEAMNAERTPILPFNVKFVFEAQGTIGSPNFREFVEGHRDMLAADVCLGAAGPYDADDAPAGAAEIPDTPANSAALKAWKEVMGKAPLLNRDATAVPALAVLQAELGLPVTAFGWGLGEDVHAPDEHLKIERYDKGREAWVKLLMELSTEDAAAQLREANAAWRSEAKGGATPAAAAADDDDDDEQCDGSGDLCSADASQSLHDEL